MPRLLSKLRLVGSALPVLILALSLTGCFLSKAQLITPQTADYPIVSGTHFDSFARRGTDWRPLPEGRTIHRHGDYYVYINDNSDRTSVPFLLMKISPGRYIVQATDTSNFENVSEYYYFLMDFDGIEAIQHSGSCWPRQAWIDEGVISQMERTSTNTRCRFTDLDSLTTVLEAASGYTAPEGKYVLDAGDSVEGP